MLRYYQTIRNFISFNLTLICLLGNMPAYAENTETNTASSQRLEQQLHHLPEKLDLLKKTIKNSANKVQNKIEEQAESLQTAIIEESTQLKKQLISPEQKHYKLEKRNFSDTQHYVFERDVKPILDKKCLACHGCYDAPCQLKMETGDGLLRGASKIKIYDGSRLNNQPPTRLGFDYQLTRDWRKHGFYPVINGYEQLNDKPTSILMLNMLDLGRRNALAINQKIPADIELGLTRQNSCPSPDEFEQYEIENPHGGMPLAVTGLTDKEYQVVSTWLKEGAKIEHAEVTLSDQQQLLIDHWESWLNRKDNRSQLLSRYLFEHLFLAHLYLDEKVQHNSVNSQRFFRLIRSSTPPGQIAIPVKTNRPNDVIEGAFFYRLQVINDTLVNKTHITYFFGEQRLKEYEKLFFNSDWSIDQLPGYSDIEKENPFETFSAIPAKIRYQFLLNDASFFVRNFIRGPVCRGQVATDVIRDQFWVMFEDPEYEQYTNNNKYQSKVNSLLGVPGQNVSLTDFGSQWLSYHDKRNQYIDLRQQQYNDSFPDGARLSHIWNGNTTNKNAFQTIFRHHDSASIVQGWQGAIPKTTWIMDYPLLERTIYELVVGFNVFGNVSHQAQTRLYFDLIRNEGETNFLRLLPAKTRSTLYQQWYAGSGKIATWIKYHDLDTNTATAINYKTTDPYTELLQRIMSQYPALTQANDPINRCSKECMQQQSTTEIAQINRALRFLTAGSAEQITGIKWLPDVSFLKVNLSAKRYRVYSLIRNRMHSNVAFMLGEALRLEEEHDSLTILPTLVGSYPNLLFQVDQADIENFTKSISSVNSDEDFEKVISNWGIRRMRPDFWEVFHSFNRYMDQHKPLEAGIYDLNRYGHY